ncbi:ribonuclease P protein component [Atopobacter sp. AH10]|uniref:ribonuclease P protein component n=1 Tax=Atopobacter sp. AH10 TaxID=2315861 RepID=UPI000EF1D451|nr:ribonuclease P protein component [Atopobacter sp. AH10]RLK62850.1 ribonuclease P protein component [Atopobacter sp. AH10]
MGLQKQYRVKTEKDYQAVFRQGKSFANRQFVIYVLKKAGQSHYRVGLSVSKKLGNAVTRNRIKRYMRDCIRFFNDQLQDDVDIVLIARKPVVSLSLDQLTHNMEHALSLAHVLKDKKGMNQL